MNRILSAQTNASGKGLNVAVSLAQLGVNTALTGFLYAENKHLHEAVLQRYGVTNRCLLCEGAARLNIKALDRSTGAVTEINDSGVQATPQQCDDVLRRIVDLAQESAYMVLTGSLPPGCPKDFYARVIEAVKTPVFLDAEGESLKTALEAGPFLIKPNRYELELLSGVPLPTLEDVSLAAKNCIRKGAKHVVVSLGAQGALYTDGSEVLFAPALSVDAVSTVGAGDGMLSGLLYGLTTSGTMEAALRCGTAAGAASVLTPGTDPLEKANFDAFLEQVQIARQ